MELKNENNENNEINKNKRTRKKIFTEEELRVRNNNSKRNYIINHRDLYNVLNRKSYKERMDKLTKEEKPYNQKVQCECGTITTRSNLNKHKKTNKHLILMDDKHKIIKRLLIMGFSKVDFEEGIAEYVGTIEDFDFTTYKGTFRGETYKFDFEENGFVKI